MTKNNKDNSKTGKVQASAMQIEISGVKINDNKPIFSELLKVYGIGNSIAEAIIKEIKLKKHSKLINYGNKIKEDLLKIMQKLQSTGFVFGNDLRMQIRQNIKAKILSGSRQGRRHASGQPVRSGNARSNSNTAKRLGKTHKITGGK